MKSIRLTSYRPIGYVALLTAVLLMACATVQAQVSFSASCSSRTVAVNQTFQVNYTVEGGEPRTLQPSFADFQVLSGPNQSVQMSFGGGGMSKVVTLSYILRPKKEGTFKIGKAKANIEGANMESNELTITVTGPVQQQAQQQQRRRDPFGMFDDDPLEEMMQQMQQSQQQPQVTQADVDKTIRENVFLRLETDKNNVYIGERITATVKVYFKLGVVNWGPVKSPAGDGFWSQEVMQKKEIASKVETFNGQQYHSAELMKFNLFPQRSGALQVAPGEVNLIVQVPVGGRSIWGQQAVNAQYKATSNPLAINVKEVPAAGKPADYTGAVGRFNYEAHISAKEGKTDNALTYTVKVSGTGNLKNMELPKPVFPDAFEVFDPKVKDDVTNSDAGMSGSMQYDYLIIPHQPGDYKIAGISFSYFDPAAGKYVTQSSPELALAITGPPSTNPNAGVAAVDKEDVSTLHSDIRFIKTKADLQKASSPLFGSATYMGMLGAPALLFIGLLFVRRRTEDMGADLVGAKRRRATKLAKKRLATADKHLAKNDKTGFYDEVSRAMWGYLGDKLNIDHSQLSKDNVEEKLVARNVKPETITKLKSLINTCELALYSPIGAGDEMRQNYNAAIELIADLEDEIK